MLKVLIVDDSLAIQRSLGRLLGAVVGVELVGCAEEVAMARRLIDATRPDVVVLDANLLDGEPAIDVLHHVLLHHPRTQVIVLSNIATPEIRRVYLRAGAVVYFDKASEFMQTRDWIAARAAGRIGP